MKKIRFSKLLNSILHRILIKYVMHSYFKKSKRVEKKHPELFRSVSSDLMELHKKLWEPLGLPCSGRWLKFHVNLSGIKDYTFCPEDIFFCRIERILNDCSISGYGVDDKNLLSMFVNKKNMPETCVRYINGLFLNKDYQFVSYDDVDTLLKINQGDLIGKPATCTSGGNGIRLFRYENGNYVSEQNEKISASWINRQGYSSYIIQKKILQASFPKSFNPQSVNTCRMLTLRCPWDGEMVVLKTMMRFGIGCKVVDNMMKGGGCVNIDHDGTLGRLGYDYNGKSFKTHPLTGILFEGLIYPEFDKMKSFALSIASCIPYMNLLSFDLVPGEDGEIKCIEINATSQGITQLQFDYGGLFGQYSKQIVDWCCQNMKNDNFTHFRSFY
jgi:hypothetical protein